MSVERVPAKKATLYRVVGVAVDRGAYRTKYPAELTVIRFLSEKDGCWSVNGYDKATGRHNLSITRGLCEPLGVPYRTVKRALHNLVERQVIDAAKNGYTTTYSLTEVFRQLCEQVYEKRFNAAALKDLLSQLERATRGPVRGPRVALASIGIEERTPNGVLSSMRRRTAEAARPDGRVTEPTQEGTPMERNIDWDDDKPKRPKKGTVWGGSAEVVLGADTTAPMAPRMIKHSPPRRKDVLAVKEYFQSKLLAFSEARHVPLWERVGKMHNNIDFLITQGHTQAIIEGAIDLFASMTAGMVFQGESLWDKFFAQRDEHIRLAAIHAIGGRGGPRESQEDKSRRLMEYQQQQKDAQS
jgi:predicted transcriptional regulator